MQGSLPLVIRVHPNLDARGGGIVSSLMATTAAMAVVAEVVVINGIDELENLSVPPQLVTIEGSWGRGSPRVARWCRRHDVPFVYVPHGSLSNRVRGQFPRKHLKKLIYWLAIERWVAAQATTIWFASDDEKSQSERTFPGMPKESVVVPLTTRNFTAQAHELGAGTSLQLVTAARVAPVKDLDVLIRALSTTGEHWHLHIAGEDEAEHARELLELAAHLHVTDRITWHGFLSSTELESLYASCHVYLCPGLESFGMSVAEALSANLPVVASDAVALALLLGDAGEVFPRGDSAALTRAITQIEQRLRDGQVDQAPRRVWDEHLSPARFRSAFVEKILSRTN